MKPIAAHSLEAQALQALRAGPMSADMASERWPTTGTRLFYQLKRLGLIEIIGSEFHITPAGRNACPNRNPLAAMAATPNRFQSEIDMSRDKPVTRQHVLDAIIAAGKAGITRKALIDQLAATEQSVDNHISILNKQMPPVIFKPEKGRVCAIAHTADWPAAEADRFGGHASREAVLAFMAGKGELAVADIAAGIQASIDSTAAVLRSLYAAMKVDRESRSGDFVYCLSDGQPENTAETETPKAPDPYKPQCKSAAERAEGKAFDFAHEKRAAGGLVPKTDMVMLSGTITFNQPKPEDTPLKPLADDIGDLEELKMAPEAIETITISAIPDRRSPTLLSIDTDDFEIGVFSDGALQLKIDDGLQDAVVDLTPAALKKLLTFLGKFQETV